MIIECARLQSHDDIKSELANLLLETKLYAEAVHETNREINPVEVQKRFSIEIEKNYDKAKEKNKNLFDSLLRNIK